MTLWPLLKCEHTVPEPNTSSVPFLAHLISNPPLSWVQMLGTSLQQVEAPGCWQRHWLAATRTEVQQCDDRECWSEQCKQVQVQQQEQLFGLKESKIQKDSGKREMTEQVRGFGKVGPDSGLAKCLQMLPTSPSVQLQPPPSPPGLVL